MCGSCLFFGAKYVECAKRLALVSIQHGGLHGGQVGSVYVGFLDWFLPHPSNTHEMESIMNDLNDVDSVTESSSTWILLQIADSGTL